MGFRSTRQRLGLADSEPADHATEPGQAALGQAAPGAAPAVPFGGYETICDRAALDRWVAAARACGMVALVPRADAHDARRGVLVGLALAVAPGKGGYLPLRHTGDLADGPPTQLDADEALTALAPLLADASGLAENSP